MARTIRVLGAGRNPTGGIFLTLEPPGGIPQKVPVTHPEALRIARALLAAVQHDIETREQGAA